MRTYTMRKPGTAGEQLTPPLAKPWRMLEIMPGWARYSANAASVSCVSPPSATRRAAGQSRGWLLRQRRRLPNRGFGTTAPALSRVLR
jgi:hypothetical protein